jgi:hypothetical protein
MSENWYYLLNFLSDLMLRNNHKGKKGKIVPQHHGGAGGRGDIAPTHS